MEPWLDNKETSAVSKYLKSGAWITEFKKTEELEKMIAEFTGSKYCLMTVNGTVTLIMALLALDLKPGDEVLVPNLSMIATPNACLLLNLVPVLIDIDPLNLCMDLDEANKKITKRTKAIIYVAFNGRSENMSQVVKFSRDNNLFLIEDSAQALGCYSAKKHLGSFGSIGSFSFSVPKIITTGQGGALVTDDKKIYTRLKKIKDFGRVSGGIDIHDAIGWNFKFTDLQAVIGIEQMKKLKKRLTRKKEIYKKYWKNLKGIEGIEFIETNFSQTSPWFIDIFVSNPKKLQLFLESKGISTRLIYPSIHFL